MSLAKSMYLIKVSELYAMASSKFLTLNSFTNKNNQKNGNINRTKNTNFIPKSASQKEENIQAILSPNVIPELSAINQIEISIIVKTIKNASMQIIPSLLAFDVKFLILIYNLLVY